MKYLNVLFACASAATLTAAIPLGNSQEASLVTRGNGVDLLPYRRALDSIMGDAFDVSAREFDEELAARDFGEDADELAQRDFDDVLERRLFKAFHKWRAGRDMLKADKYKAKADRQLKASGGSSGIISGSSPSPGGGGGSEDVAARGFEDDDELAQRDFDDVLERRLFKAFHKWRAGRDMLKADKYKAKADRQLKASGGSSGILSGSSPSPGGGGGSEDVAARGFEDGDELAQRDFDDVLERRLFKALHKWRAGRDMLKADKYKAKADRQLKASGGTSGILSGSSPSPGAGGDGSG